MANILAMYKGTVLSNDIITCDIHEMKILCLDIMKEDILPGQFIHIKIPQASHLLLRRPISIHHIDKQNGYLSIIYQIRGEGTRILSTIKKDHFIDFLGALGTGFKMPEAAKSVMLVGGGMGIAPLRYILDYWKDKEYISFLGFRNQDASYAIDVFRNHSKHIFVATDDGSLGERGNITLLFAREIAKHQPDIVMACGPALMLKCIQEQTKKFQVSCQISLEERMGCGIGGCLVCNCKTRMGDQWVYKRVCVDGPVFDGREVILNDRL